MAGDPKSNMGDQIGTTSFGVGHIEPDNHSDDSVVEDVRSYRANLHAELGRYNLTPRRMKLTVIFKTGQAECLFRYGLSTWICKYPV